VLLDELLGDGFALVAVGGDSSALNDAVRKAQWPQPPPIIINVISVDDPWPDDPWLPGSPVITVRDPSGMLRDWYSQHRIDLTLLRPDRYIFGGYHRDDIDRARVELRSALDGDDKTTRVEE
jgi:3-(3-hydroxy-phenyl)propionate hydroxylase